MIKIEELDEMRRMSIRERSEKLNVPMYKMLMNIPQFYKRYRQAIQEIHLFPKMNYVLNELGGKGIKTAIISSNSEEKYDKKRYSFARCHISKTKIKFKDIPLGVKLTDEEIANDVAFKLVVCLQACGKGQADSIGNDVGGCGLEFTWNGSLLGRF
jgi:hypothetical protein